MATFAPNYSNRYQAKYRAMGKVHTFSCRYGITPEPPPIDLVTGVGNLFAALAPVLPNDFAWLSAKYIAAGTTVALPASLPASLTGGFTWTKGDAPRFFSFTGAGITGQPAVLYIYGASFDPGDDAVTAANDYRILRSEHAAIAAALDELAGIPEITTQDGTVPIWNQYANVSYSRYWQRQARKG